MKTIRVFTHHEHPREAAELYLKNDVIAVGFVYDENVAKNGNENIIKKSMRKRWPLNTKGQIDSAASHFLKFRDKIEKGNLILAYEGKNIVSAIGTVIGECEFNNNNIIGNYDGMISYPNQRRVKWEIHPRFFTRWELNPEIIRWVALRGTVYIKETPKISRIDDLVP